MPSFTLSDKLTEDHLNDKYKLSWYTWRIF